MSNNKFTITIDKKSKTNSLILFGNCCIAIFPLCLAINFYCLMQFIIDYGVLTELFKVIVIGFSIVFFVALRFSFFSFIKSYAEKYKLLIILGIKTSDFWKVIVNEFCSKVIFTGIKAIIINNILSSIISAVIFLGIKNIEIKILINNFFITIVIMFLVYIAILSFSMFIIVFKEKKKNLIIFFEKLLQDTSKLHSATFLYVMSPIIGIVLIMSSFALLINYSVGKMFVAIFVNFIGFFLLIHSNGKTVKKTVKRFKSKYYGKIIQWNDLIYQYKINANVIFIIYILNFFLIFIIGGLIVSESYDDNYTGKYPYESIAYGNENNFDSEDSYPCILVNIQRDGQATVISNSDYNKLNKVNYVLNKGEALCFYERVKENSIPLNREKISVLSNGKVKEYVVDKESWEIVFGENIIPELNEIIVLNDEDFELTANHGTLKSIYVSEKSFSNHLRHENRDTLLWSRTDQINKDKIQNRIINTIIYITGLILILEVQILVGIKQILNWKEEKHRYIILKQLGICKNELVKIIEDKIKNILILPVVLAVVSSFLFFIADSVYQEQQSVLLLFILTKYIIVVLSFILLEFIGYQLVIRQIKKYYLV